MNLKEFPPFNGNMADWINTAIRFVRQNNAEINKSVLKYIIREQGTGQKWVDGTEIFHKSIAITEAFCTTNATNIAHGITGFNELVKAEGRFEDANVWFTTPFVKSAVSVDFSVSATNVTSVIVGTPTYSSFGSGYVTLWYTRT